MIIASAIFAVIPMFSYLILIWLFDRYEREPFGLVLRNYLWGAFGAVILALLGSFFLSTFFSFFIDKKELSNISAFFIAPFVEESTKGLFLLITIRNLKFDNLTDGIVYGGAIGLGFGMTENFLYFLSYSSSLNEWIYVIIVRTLFSAVMHCVSTAAVGASFGYAKYKSGISRYIIPTAGFAIAIFIHFMWNYSISFSSTTLPGFLFLIFTIGIFIVVFSVSILNEKKIIYNELMEEADTGLIPFEHLSILSSPKRNKYGWVDESIRKLYIRAATILAFRKMEYKNLKGNGRIFYLAEVEKDIDYYRNFIGKLLVK
jgi:protease PrsW